VILATLKINAAICSVLLCTGLLTSCKPLDHSSVNTLTGCDAETTRVTAVQGDGYKSAMVGSEVTIRGIVTRIEAGTGFTIEEQDAEGPLTRSSAIFIEDKALSSEPRPGQMMVISGRVTELGKAKDTLTALTRISGHQFCSGSFDLPRTRVKLPLDSRQRESIESMSIALDQGLTITDVYNLHRGEVTLSANGALRVPAEDNPPGQSATRMAKDNREWSVLTATSGAKQAALPYGTTVIQAAGIMGNNGKEQVLLLDQPLIGSQPNLPELKAPEKNKLRVVSFNLLNFFNGDGRGGGFPTERGAKSRDDFQAQADRTRSAISMMKPHLLAVQELENDGFGPHSAASSLLDLLNESGQGEWSSVKLPAGQIGHDIITVGLFYRSDLLLTEGPAQTLDSSPFRNLSRQPLAQLFRERATGQRFLIAVNHLKSKGGCPKKGKNTDQRDGQGCWNPARVAAAEAVSDWVRGLAEKFETDLMLIVGDMNAWRRSDPISTFRNKGFVEIVEHVAGLPQHSYVYWGEAGTLDYAFASDALLRLVSHAEIGHINSNWPQKMNLPKPWLRSSDHDPVAVDLDFSQAETSN
jgi:predicted extracellular nuclease